MLESSMLTDGRSGDNSEDSEMETDRQIKCQESVPIKPGQIGILPDDALLTIFLLCNDASSSDLSWWQPLVHVCRRWRQVIFASPLHLNLTLVCTAGTPSRVSLDMWPPIPIALHFTSYGLRGYDDNIVAAMERPDRINDIRLEYLTFLNFNRLTRMMESPFPALTYLSLRGDGIPELNSYFILRDVFLGGAAPSLRTFSLCHIRFPALPKLLLSTTQLVTLRLSLVPTLRNMSLREIVTCLAALPKLKQLDITHFYKFPDPDQSSLRTRVVLPSLTSFYFNGISGHLEDLVGQIDAPMLQALSLTLGAITRVPQLLRFISRAEKLKPPTRAVFVFGQWRLLLKFIPSDGVKFSTSAYPSAGQFMAMGLLCFSLSPLLSRVERLDFRHSLLPPLTQDFVDSECWLNLFRPFIAVQSLCVPKKAWPQVEFALQALSERRATEVLPELCTLYLEEPFEEARKSIESLISARRLTVQPYTAAYLDTKC